MRPPRVALVMGVLIAAVCAVAPAEAAGPITIGTSGGAAVQAADPYPSTEPVSGKTGQVTDVNVSFTGFSHEFVSDVDILLVGPSGASAMIMSDVVSGPPGVSNLDITLDDEAAANLPDASNQTLTSGSYKPANYQSAQSDSFPSPAPAFSGASALSAFDGTDPNGDWDLYVVDDGGPDSGSIQSWSLTVTTGTPGTQPQPPPPPRAPTVQTCVPEALALPGAACATVTATEASLHGTVAPNGAATSCQFKWGRTAAYDKAGQVYFTDLYAGVLVGNAAGLKPNTTYHLQFACQNSAGRSAGLDRTFRTDPLFEKVSVSKFQAGSSVSGTVSLAEAAKRVVATVTEPVKARGAAAAVRVLGRQVKRNLKAGKVKVKVKLGRKGRRELRRKGRLRLKLRIAVTPRGSAKPFAVTRKVTLKRR